MCVLIFSTTFVCNTSHSKNWQQYEHMYNGRNIKYLLFLSDFNEISIFSTQFRKIPQYQI